MQDDRVQIQKVEVLSHDWYLLQKTTFNYRRSNGTWQTLTRETYDRGHGATILLYNLVRQSVILVRQFRFPTYGNGHDGFLIETPAGLLDDASPEQRIKAEVEEETGYRVAEVRKVFESFMSPGSVTERLHFFVAEYEADERPGAGGGLEAEGEDIEVLELPLRQALRMVANGEIADGKTIMLLQYAQQHLFPPAAVTAATPAGMMILIAGPYRSGTGDDPALMAKNVAAMEAYVVPLYEAGHMPVLGEWLALPLLQAAGSTQVGDTVFERIFHAHATRLLAHCDAVLRVGGASAGADAMVRIAQERALPVFHSLADIVDAPCRAGPNA
jgi:ADP-ribose pyrophosphatase